MTKRGIFSLVFESFLLIMALGTDIREFLIVAVCVGGLLLYSLLSILLSVLTLKFKSSVDEEEVSRGEEIEYTLSICGVVILPVAGKVCIKAADIGDITDKSTLKHAFLLLPSLNTKKDYVFKLQCEHTGYWDIGIEKLRIIDLFGMFSLPLFRTNRKDFTVNIAVCPKIHNLIEDNEHINVLKGYGGAATLNSENGEMLGDSRLYRDGDAMRRINWKQSVRMRKLFTRQYELPEIPKVVIAIDTACGTDKTGTIADIYCETAVSLAKYYMESKHTVNVITVRNSAKADKMDSYYKDMRDLTSLRYELMNISFHEENTPLDLYRLDQSNFANADRIYILTSHPSAAMLSAMADVIKQGKNALCIMPQLGDEPEPTVAKAINDTGITPVTVKSVDKIARKVGGEV